MLVDFMSLIGQTLKTPLYDALRPFPETRF